MIQRIQTVYLAVGAALLAVTPFAGQLTMRPAAELTWFLPTVGAGLGLAFVTALVAVAMYGNRKRQRGVVVVAQLLTLVALIALFVGRRSAEAMPGAEFAAVSDWLLFGLPVVAYVLFLLARRAIDRDIKLIKSVDRLR